jgi:TRAP-type C4-dicarboxylate transport system permease small subunit
MQIAAIDRRSDIAGIPMVIPHAAVATGLVLLAALAVLRLFRPARAEGEGA